MQATSKKSHKVPEVLIHRYEGEPVTVKDITKTFDKETGRESGKSYIYMLAGRHGWRMVVQKSKHPNKASEEDADTSRKISNFIPAKKIEKCLRINIGYDILLQIVVFKKDM